MEGLQKGEILNKYFSQFVNKTRKIQQQKTSMTKHETASAANEVCLVNSTVSSVMLREMLALAAH